MSKRQLGSESSDRAAATELRRCIYSVLGQLEYVCEHMPVCPEGFALRAMIEGGVPEMIPLVNVLCGDEEPPEKSFNRGYQVMALMAREEEGGERDREAWRQDPDEFMAEYRT